MVDPFSTLTLYYFDRRFSHVHLLRSISLSHCAALRHGEIMRNCGRGGCGGNANVRCDGGGDDDDDADGARGTTSAARRRSATTTSPSKPRDVRWSQACVERDQNLSNLKEWQQCRQAFQMSARVRENSAWPRPSRAGE